MIRHINKTTDESNQSFSLMGEGPYAFKTLWQEITKGIQAIVGSIASIGNTRNNNSAATEQIYWLKSREGNDEMTKNTGFYIIIGLALVLVTTIIIINNTKKS